MQNDLISRDFTVKALREYAEQKHAGGEVELANGILKAVNFLQKEENVPTAYNVENVVEKINKITGTHTVGIYATFSNDLYIPKEEVLNIVCNGGKE